MEPAETAPKGPPHKAVRAARTGRRRWVVERLLAEGLIVAAILGWWALSLGMPDYVMPGPLVVGGALVKLFIDPEFLAHTVWSTIRVVSSVIIAVLLGWALAQLAHRFALAREIVHDRIKPFLNSFPSVGWAILAVIWFGTSDGSIIFVEVAILTPFCLVNISEGLKELDRELVEMGASFTRNRRKAFFKITVPLLMPYVMAAVRIAYGVGWKIALVAELFGAETGLGFLMQRAQTLADAATVFATCFAIVLIFFAGEKLVIDPLARRFQHR